VCVCVCVCGVCVCGVCVWCVCVVCVCVRARARLSYILSNAEISKILVETAPKSQDITSY